MTCKIVFLMGFTTVFAIRFYFARLLQSSKVKDDRKTPLEIVLLGLTLLCAKKVGTKVRVIFST
ncbi:hypothetical protein BZZ01_17315 [Nostocales cyanobacterium HT-58-2]|nr:hypothetical protein BZZ01_17315 [Nostocales cyanobacterium HT-58-2]